MQQSDLILGITGTKEGATRAQKDTLLWFLHGWYPAEFHAGDCVGVDAEAVDIMRAVHPDTVIVGHPPLNPAYRAFKQYDREEPLYEYLVRDKMIVRASMHLIAVPKGFTEQRRSGTWTTWRYAQASGVPCTIIWPDGTYSQDV